MDQERARIQADLRGRVAGPVRCDEVTCQLYASDASIYEIQPLGVVCPASVEDVLACVEYARENELAIHPRGAGSGVAGESLGRGLVLDFSHSMRRVLEFGENTVRVQPGVVLSQLNRSLAEKNLMFGPDPATRSVTTIGSVLSLDASGSHWLRYGTARSHVEHIQTVLSNGEIIEARKIDLNSRSTESPTHRLALEVSQLVSRHQETLKEYLPKSLVNRCGYQMHDILQDTQLDLAKLLVGSEGTLGLFTEATLKVVPRPKHRGVVLLFFDRLDSAARAAIEVSGSKVAACDLLDRRLLSIARELDNQYAMTIPLQAEAMLLIEVQDDDPAEVRAAMDQLVTRLKKKRRLAFEARSTMELQERNRFWRLTRRVITTLYRLKGNTRALPFIEDIAVAPQDLPRFLVGLQNILKSQEVTASLFSHAGHGQLHIRPFLDLGNPEHTRKIEPLARELYDLVVQFKGTISGEHGLGLSRTWFMKRFCGPLYRVYQELKQRFDPDQLLNPGKVIAETPQSPSDNLRPTPRLFIDKSQPNERKQKLSSESVSLPIIDLQMNWDTSEFYQASRMCNGCARCRTTNPEERMCPTFRPNSAEEASPRAKANLMRAIMTGRLDPKQLESDELKQVADLCINCHQCRIECPAGVNVPKLMHEAKAQYVRTNGMKLSTSLLARIDRWIAISSTFGPVANWALESPTMRWVLERALGIAQGRKLPRISSRPFLKTVTRQRLHRPNRSGTRKVLYFVDTFANWHDPLVGECFLSILKHNRISAYVPLGQSPSGMPLLSMGAIDRAKKIARRNLEILADAVRQGYQIVATEPAAALCIKQEYPNLVNDEDAMLVAEHTSEACDYFWKLHQQGDLELDFQPLNQTIGYHLPCHSRALNPESAAEMLLRMIPGLTVRRIEKGCSGMAGTWGLHRENYRKSLRIGRDLMKELREPDLNIGATECSACRIQMEQGTTKPTLHPLKVLAWAYKLHPEIEEFTRRRSNDLTLASI